MEKIYYAQRKSVKNGSPVAPNNRYGTKAEMERQFHLYCANACDGEENPYDIDAIEWGTVEHGIIERKCYIKETQPEEPETEGEA